MAEQAEFTIEAYGIVTPPPEPVDDEGTDDEEGED